MKTSAEFIQELLSEFPDMREYIEEDADLPYCQMGWFSHCTQEAIDARDFDLLRRHFALADRYFQDADEHLKNMFYVSYLDHLSFAGRHGAKAFALMPPALQAGWREMEEFWKEFERQQRNENA